ncbi:hypothetical protein H4R19_000393 [Coemansia spiralis]|nr:hypothetical protein H4R19_000393 [Coemansia spiralis]
MEPTILSAGSDQLLTKWNQAIDMAGPDGRTRVCFFEDLMLMAFDVMTSLSFGQAHRSLTTGERHVLDMVRQCLMLVFLEEFAPIVKHPLVNWLIRPIHAQVDKFFAFIMDNINARRRLLESGAEKPKDILQEFLDAEDPDSKVHMTPSQVRTEAIVNVVAGSDTSALTLSWTLHLLMLHPHCLKLVVDEVRSAFPAGHTIRFEEAKEKLPYLEACLYESMRIRPVAGNLPRVIPSGGATFQGHFIPGGYSCAVSIAVVNSNKDAWANHDVFDPERFLDNPDNKRKMVTFSAGVRICPGRHLAWWNMTTALANIINSYDIALPDDALFTPNKLGANGQPVIMPERYNIIRFPKHPKRDCVALISKRAV